MVILMDDKAHPIELLSAKTTHWDIVLELDPNDFSVY